MHLELALQESITRLCVEVNADVSQDLELKAVFGLLQRMWNKDYQVIDISKLR